MFAVEHPVKLYEGTEYIIDRSVHGQSTEKFAKQDMNLLPVIVVCLRKKTWRNITKEENQV